MKLTLCVPLIWMLFSSAEALKCVQENLMFSTVSVTDPQPCKSPDVHCATIAYQDFTTKRSGSHFFSRTCAPSSLCNEGNQSISMSFGDHRITASLQCCSTDGCNNKPIPYPDKQKPNGLQCFTRKRGYESNLEKLQCVGIENRCSIRKNDPTDPSRGCMSANLCEEEANPKLMAIIFQSFIADAEHRSNPGCCETSLCNSAPADKLSVIPLLLGVVALLIQ
ncbi:urokinase plasminogen activator surface receptor-like isoform X2 [Halichoeres trimaculatus]